MENIQEREPPNVITSDTENATRVHPSDAPFEKQEKFRRFRAYNTGMWNGPRRENTEQFRRQDNLHRYDSLASAIDLNRFQKKRGRKIIDDLHIKDFGIHIDKVIFGVCVLVANDDVESGSRYYPHPEAAGDSAFVDVAESLGFSRHDQISAVEKVRAQTNF